MGNTGYGYGILNEWCTTGGLDNWITPEFFRQYGTEGHGILGNAYAQTLTSYVNVFRTESVPDFGWDSGHEKTVQQWVLHGDPSLKLGGYQSQAVGRGCLNPSARRRDQALLRRLDEQQQAGRLRGWTPFREA